MNENDRVCVYFLAPITQAEIDTAMRGTPDHGDPDNKRFMLDQPLPGASKKLTQ